MPCFNVVWRWTDLRGSLASDGHAEWSGEDPITLPRDQFVRWCWEHQEVQPPAGLAPATIRAVAACAERFTELRRKAKTRDGHGFARAALRAGLARAGLGIDRHGELYDLRVA
ncbi:MAG: hypothetical protein FJ125_18335, partial [Deltaproteobacteria bacterium]|nr:hypothetical protein [Deltaproteobacteria bacterium]